VAVTWLLTLPAAATVGALAAWVAAGGAAGTVLVAAAMIVLAGLIYGLSRRKPVTAGTVNDAPPPRPVAVAARVAA
jgi:PiT family inorganic phosphate transporter